jgi:glycoside/pentoside/hexuronide:cation symporter, GPH family
MTEVNVAGTLESEQPKAVFPRWRIILFSFGGSGATLIATLVGLATYFYIPPGNGQADFASYIPMNMFLGITIFGLIMFIGNLPTVLLYPFVASWSDNSKSKLGRRKKFLLISFLPIAVLSMMIFTPPVAHESYWNALYLFGVIVLLSVFRCFANVAGAIPPEYSTTQKQIMYFSIFGSVGWIIGYLLGSQVVYLIKNTFTASGMSITTAFQITVGMLIGIGAIISTFQFLILDDKKYGDSRNISVNVWKSMKLIMKDKDYMLWILISVVYFWGDAIFNAGLVYYVTVNYQFSENLMTLFGGILIGVSLILYPVVNKVVLKHGKKKPFAFTLFVMSFGMVLFAFPNLTTLPRIAIIIVIMGFLSIYSAFSGIIPGAIGNEIIKEGCMRRGVGNEATYGATGGLLTYIPGSLPALIIPSILLLGKTQENHTGVTLLALICGVIMVTAALLLIFLYNEKRIVASLKQHGYE